MPELTTPPTTTSLKDTLLAEFARREAEWSKGPGAWYKPTRDAAIARFAELGIPTLRTEYWRNTNLRTLEKTSFVSAPTLQPEQLKNPFYESLFFEGQEAARLVFINGQPARALWSLDEYHSGSTIKTLSDAFEADRDLLERHLSQYASWKDHPFAALNTALLTDGAFIHIPKGVAFEKPIHLVFITTTAGSPVITHPRNVILVEEGGRANFIETYANAGAESDVYFTNSVTELLVDENAIVDHCKVQRESEAAYHIATQESYLRRSANFTSHNVVLGGSVVRNDINASLNDEGIECLLHGLYLPRHAQHVDNHTRMDHAKPHCHSYELYKGILDDKATGVFNGRIVVRPDAQKTDAVQANHTLLLTDGAAINTRPQLEIFADDVKCTHGATIGELDDDAIFYLRTRGIDERTARAILISSFANEIIDPIKFEPLREHLLQLVGARFHQSRNVEGI